MPTRTPSFRPRYSLPIGATRATAATFSASVGSWLNSRRGLSARPVLLKQSSFRPRYISPVQSALRGLDDKSRAFVQLIEGHDVGRYKVATVQFEASKSVVIDSVVRDEFR